MKIALVENTTVHQVWPTSGNELSIRHDLPDGTQVSPVCLGWSNDRFAVLPVVEFTIPVGKQIAGPAEYVVEGGEVVETYPVEDAVPLRTLIRKSIVQQRLIDTGKMNAAYAALTSNATYFARWFAPDRPQVYCDDPDALQLLAAIGADPLVIMAEEE